LILNATLYNRGQLEFSHFSGSAAPWRKPTLPPAVR